ncbi:ABC transporter permease [Thiohalorhabdus methylotrophus]|uniref:Transport permease protein n=1 Tax=Thiohalorhabdus methylotrophus TaxID=3242694 RepID=A0ABV4TUR9_9GAMM
MNARAFRAIMRREIVRMFRQRGRLASAVIRPLIWLAVIGSGFEALLSRLGSGSYQAFMVPGLTGMTLLFGAMLAALSLVYDKESGVMRMLLIAPFARSWIVVARTLSAAVAALIQALLLLAVFAALGFILWPLSFGLLALGLLLTALTCASIGMLIAVGAKSLDNFAVVMNFVIFPLFFLSGALYPIANLPPLLQLVARINPFSYGVDLLKHGLTPDMAPPFGPDFPVAVNIAVTGGFVLLAMVAAGFRFSRGPFLEALAAVVSTSKQR